VNSTTICARRDSHSKLHHIEWENKKHNRESESEWPRESREKESERVRLWIAKAISVAVFFLRQSITIDGLIL
jgi:hypothetical protein